MWGRMGSDRFAFAAIALLVAACVPAPRSGSTAPADAAGRFGDRVLVEPVLIPVAWLQRDLDGVAPRPEQVDAVGAGLRAALGNREQSVGISFQDFRGDDDRLDVRTLGVDFDARSAIEGTDGLFFLRAGGGVGAGWYDAPFGSSRDTLAWQLHMGLDVQPLDNLAFGIGVGGLLLGYPGETEVYGAFVLFSAVLTF